MIGAHVLSWRPRGLRPAGGIGGAGGELLLQASSARRSLIGEGMTMNASSNALTRAALLAVIALSPLVVAACSPTPLSTAQPEAATSGIGDWHLTRPRGVWLLNLQFPVGYQTFQTAHGNIRLLAHTGNQFPVTPDEIGLSKSFTSGQPVHFTIVRDAGTFACVGQVWGDEQSWSQLGAGSVVAFRPNDTFLREEAPHFSYLTEIDKIRLALFDIDHTFMADAVRPGRRVTVMQLVELKMAQRWAAMEQKVRR
jgi:hypothetical protein